MFAGAAKFPLIGATQFPEWDPPDFSVRSWARGLGVESDFRSETNRFCQPACGLGVPEHFESLGVRPLPPCEQMRHAVIHLRNTHMETYRTTAASAHLDSLLKGIGRGTAEYVLLRGLGRLDVFPGDDVGARGNLARWLETEGIMDYLKVEGPLKQWAPDKGLIYFHLLLDGLERTGQIVETPQAA